MLILQHWLLWVSTWADSHCIKSRLCVFNSCCHSSVECWGQLLIHSTYCLCECLSEHDELQARNEMSQSWQTAYSVSHSTLSHICSLVRWSLPQQFSSEELLCHELLSLLHRVPVSATHCLSEQCLSEHIESCMQCHRHCILCSTALQCMLSQFPVISICMQFSPPQIFGQEHRFSLRWRLQQLIFRTAAQISCQMMENKLITLSRISATDSSAVRWGRSLWSHLFSLCAVFNTSAFWQWHCLHLISSLLSCCCQWLIIFRVSEASEVSHIRYSRGWRDLLCSCLSCLQLLICSSSWSQMLQKMSDNLSVCLHLMLLSSMSHCWEIAHRLCADTTQRLHNCALSELNICCSSCVLFLQTTLSILLSVSTVQLHTVMIVLTCHLNCSVSQHSYQSWDGAAPQQLWLACNESETYLTAACLLTMTQKGRFSVWSICMQQCPAASSVNELSWSSLQQAPIMYSILAGCIGWQRCHSASACVTHYQSYHCLFISLFPLWSYAAEWSVTSHSSVSALQGSDTEDQIVQLSVKREEIVSSYVSNCHNDVLSCLQSFTSAKSHLMQSAVFSPSLSLLLTIIMMMCWAVCSHSHSQNLIFCSSLTVSHISSLIFLSMCADICLCQQFWVHSVLFSSASSLVSCSQFSSYLDSCLQLCAVISLITHLMSAALISSYLILSFLISLISLYLVSLSVSVCSLCTVCSSHILSCLVLSALLILSVCSSLSAVSVLSAVFTSCLILSCLLCSSHFVSVVAVSASVCSSHIFSHLTHSSQLVSVAVLISVCSFSVISLILSHSAQLDDVLQSLCLSAVSASYLVSFCSAQLCSSCQHCCSLCICLQSLHLVSSCFVSLNSSQLFSIAVPASVCSLCVLFLLSHLTQLSSSWCCSLPASVCSLCLISCLTQLTLSWWCCSLCICLQSLCLITLVLSHLSAQLTLVLSSLWHLSAVCISSLASFSSPHLGDLQSLCLSAVSASCLLSLVSLILSACLLLPAEPALSAVSASSLVLSGPAQLILSVLQLLHLSAAPALSALIVSIAVTASVCSLCIPSSCCQHCSFCICLQLSHHLQSLSLILCCLVSLCSPHLVSVIAASASVCSLCVLSHLDLLCSAHISLSVLQSSYLSAVLASHLSSHLTQLSLMMCCNSHICLQSLCLVSSHLALLSSAHLFSVVAAPVSVCSLCLLTCLVSSHSTQLTFSVLYPCICLQSLCLVSLISSCSAQLIFLML